MQETANCLTTVLQKAVSMKYLLYLPDAYQLDPNRKWPLLIYLHGAAQRGDELELVKKKAVPKML